MLNVLILVAGRVFPVTGRSWGGGGGVKNFPVGP
jgi:hypothetical protein